MDGTGGSAPCPALTHDLRANREKVAAEFRAYGSPRRLLSSMAFQSSFWECQVMAKPPLDTIIRVDRSVRPVYPEWVKKVMHPELEGTGPAEYDLAKVEQWFHDEQTKDGMVGNRIYEHLKSNNMLDSCLGLRDLEEIQKKGVTFFREPFKGKVVFGW